MKRLPKGFGSIHKLSGNRRKPYAARVLTGKNENGKNIFKYIGYFKTSKEALIALTEFNKGSCFLEGIDYTISDLFELFKKRRFDKLSHQGVGVYNAAFKHLSPLQQKKIRNIKTSDMQSVIDAMTTGWQSKSHVQTLLRQLFDIAMELDIIQKNYAKFITLPPKEKSCLHHSFTESEIALLFRQVWQYPYADTVLILIYTGMRPSELLNIRKQDIDLICSVMTGGLKTAAGKNRLIPIHNKILPFIQHRYSACQYYLVEENGKPLSYIMYKKRFLDVMKALQMSHLPHDGRHTFASLMDSAGANKQAIKLIMGHTVQDITDSVYIHKSKDELLYNIHLI